MSSELAGDRKGIQLQKLCSNSKKLCYKNSAHGICFPFTSLPSPLSLLHSEQTLGDDVKEDVCRGTG